MDYTMPRKAKHKGPRAKLRKAPGEWTTGDEPMTLAQESYYHTLCTEAGVKPKKDLTKAQASIEIDLLQQRTGRKRKMH